MFVEQMSNISKVTPHYLLETFCTCKKRRFWTKIVLISFLALSTVLREK